MSLQEMPEKPRAAVLKAMENGLSRVQQQVEEVLRDYFGCASVVDLVRKGDDSEALAVRLNEAQGRAPLLSAEVHANEARLRVKAPLPEVGWPAIRGPHGEPFHFWPEAPELFGLPELLWAQLLSENGVARDAYYLPAARSGILQGWQAFASIALQAVRQRVGLERIEVPPLAGVAGDFMQVLLERVMQPHVRRPRGDTKRMEAALRVLEEEAFAGEVYLETRGPADRGLIFYKTKHLSLPLNRASSMVAELAPLVLWIKYLLGPGDLLIIDEPEAHLHPENQRRVARALVRLVHAGVRVLCTTHSPTILHQVSNHVLACEASSQKRRRLGFTSDDLLEKNDVAVHLFDLQDDGTHISPLTIVPGFGIPEDEFLRVSEAIGDETSRLANPKAK